MSDLINRQQAIDVLEEQLNYLFMLNKEDNPTAESKWYGINWARNTIAELPSAEPKVGRWIEVRFKTVPTDRIARAKKCSICGKRKGEPMKGLMNNEEAVRVFHNLKDSMINPIHQIYNLGYKQGHEDGYYDCMQKLTEQILAERRTDEHNTKRD